MSLLVVFADQGRESRTIRAPLYLGRSSYVRIQLLKTMYTGSACVSMCSAWDVRLTEKARPDCPSTPSSQSSAAVESGSGSSQDEQQEALCSVEVGELPQQMSYIPVFGLRSLQQQQQQQRQHGKAAKHDSEAVSSVGSGNSSVAVNSGKDRDAVQSTPGDGDQLGISDLHQHSLQLALEHSSADWLKQPPETFVPWLGAPPAWLCGQDSSSVDPWSTSRLSELPEPLPTHVPKLCVTVSRVSSELDSLAIPVLKTLAPVSRGDASSPGLSGSRHLGEF